jgi:hypothetical protein
MTVQIILAALGLIAAGVTIGIIGLVSVAIRREEKNFSLTSETVDHVTRAGRWLNGVYVRCPCRSVATYRQSGADLTMPGIQVRSDAGPGRWNASTARHI